MSVFENVASLELRSKVAVRGSWIGTEEIEIDNHWLCVSAIYFRV